MKEAWESCLFRDIYRALSIPRPEKAKRGSWGSPPGWLTADPLSLHSHTTPPMEAALWPEGRDLVILVHGVGVAGTLWKLYGRIVRGLQKRDTACALLFLPRHGPRSKSEDSPAKHFGAASPGEYLAWAHASVADIRGLALWGRDRYRRTGLFGVSLGGMIGTIALAVEKRLDVGYLVITGGGLLQIAEHRPARFLPRPGSLANLLLRQKATQPCTAREHLSLLDPLTFAPLVGRERVRMAIARWDPVMPRAASMNLWRALGRPPIDRVSGIHGSVLLFHRDLFVRRMTELLDKPQRRPTS